MGNVNFYVLMDRGKWFVQLNGKQFGPCSTKDRAIETAVTIAKQAVLKGCSAEVLLEGPQRFRTVWSSRRLAALA